uniref:Uncharacterized protein n=1 Tax=Romanomermis culicivorax TaxID=13658 RepID=A0A915I452_ROMCU
MQFLNNYSTGYKQSPRHRQPRPVKPKTLNDRQPTFGSIPKSPRIAEFMHIRKTTVLLTKCDTEKEGWIENWLSSQNSTNQRFLKSIEKNNQSWFSNKTWQEYNFSGCSTLSSFVVARSVKNLTCW